MCLVFLFFRWDMENSLGPLCFMSNLGYNKHGILMHKCELEKINRYTYDILLGFSESSNKLTLKVFPFFLNRSA